MKTGEAKTEAEKKLVIWKELRLNDGAIQLISGLIADIRREEYAIVIRIPFGKVAGGADCVERIYSKLLETQ